MLRCLTTIFILLVSVSSVLSAEPSQVDSTRSKNPRLALFLSVIPGMGQLYNQRYLKSILYLGTFSYFTYEYDQAVQAYNAAGEGSTNISSLHRTRNDYAWLMGLTWTISLLDAFIDAHLWDFDSYEVIDTVPDDTLTVEPQEIGIDNDRE